MIFPLSKPIMVSIQVCFWIFTVPETGDYILKCNFGSKLQIILS